jgi:hypothetical protein
VQNRQVVEDPVTMLVSIRQRPIQKTARFAAANWSILIAANNSLVSGVVKQILLILAALMVITFVMSVMAKVFSIQSGNL